MVISNSRKFIFVHITKAAGTSVTYALDEIAQWNDIVLGGTAYGGAFHGPFKDRFGLHKHSLARDVRAVVGTDVWDAYYKFTFVRHPFARAVSLYTFIDTMVKRRWPGRYRRFLPLGKKFKERWQWNATLAYLDSKNFSEFIRHEKFKTDWGAQTQASWVSDEQGNVIMDFIGRVERLEQDMLEVSNKIGLKNLNTFRKETSEGKKPLHEYFGGEDDYSFLADMYRADFELFDYDPKLRY